MNTFTEYQFAQFDINFKKVMRGKLMSFYSYLTYRSTETTTIKMSIDELTDRWNNKHKKKARTEKCVCKTTIYNWIKKLQKANLLYINEDSADTFIYTLTTENIFVNKEVNKELNENNTSLHVENTEFVDSESCDNSLHLVDNLDIDSNTSALAPNVVSIIPPVHLNFKKYIEKCSYDYAMSEMLNVFQILKVKSNFIKSIVIEKVEKYYWNISKCGVVQYIAKLISQARAQAKKNFGDKCLYNSSGKVSTWNDYPQRAYDFDELEKKLLGWDN